MAYRELQAARSNSPNDGNDVVSSGAPSSEVPSGATSTGDSAGTSVPGQTSTTAPTSTQPGSEQGTSTVPNVTGGTGATSDTGSVGTTSAAGSDGSTTPSSDSSGGIVPVEDPGGQVGFSVPSCTFEGSLMVTIATTGTGVEVRYTTDGTLPTATSTLYDGAALTLTETTQLRAQTFVDGMPSGLGSTAIYIRRTFDVSSDISLVIMEAYGGGKPPTQAGPEKVIYRDLGFMLFEPVDGTAAISALPTWASRAGYHVRGQSSASFEKTPYRVELWDENNEDIDRPMIGMPADSDWAMIGEYSDKTLTRNAFSFSLAVDMGLQAPEMRFTEGLHQSRCGTTRGCRLPGCI